MPDEIDGIAAFIAFQQARPGHRMAEVGVQSGEIADQIRGADVWFASRQEEGALTAVLGIEHDPELRRCWLYGPFVADEARWGEIADELWDEVASRIPAGTRDVEIGYAQDNDRAAAFARRHGFKIYSEGSLMSFPRARLAELPASPDVRDFDPADGTPVARLHDELFPRASPTPAQLLERLDEHRRVFVATGDEGVVGYAYAEAKPEHGEGFIDFVGVTEAARGRGVARRMVAASLRWLLSFEGIDEIELFVRDNNPAGERVYSSVGFTKGVALTGARKHLDAPR